MMTETSFWPTLPRPILGLAPMSGITDQPFRHLQKRYGNPAVVYTEFTPVEGYFTKDARLLRDFLYDETQRPVVAQIYGRSPAHFHQMAVLICQLGFDGIDLNMGCPTRSVAHSGSGAALIKTPALAQQIILAAKAGVQAWANGATVRDYRGIPGHIARLVEARHVALPPAYQARRAISVSVKTRIGFDEPRIEEWVPQVLEAGPAALAIHGRTLRQAYGGHADWSQLARAAAVARGSGVVLLGNGDVQSRAEALQRTAECDLDGVLIGRAACGNPFVFCTETQPDPQPPAETQPQPDRYRRVRLAIEHALLYEATFQHRPAYHFLPMRKHLAWYVQRLPSAHHLRHDLLQVRSAAEAVAVLENYLARHPVAPVAG